jgi:uncharacterized protein YheU (UPF0270 family)
MPLASFVHIPLSSLPFETLQAMLEDYCSRDGTDYGLHETALAAKCGQVRAQLERGELMQIYDADSQTWDVLPPDRGRALLGEGAG